MIRRPLLLLGIALILVLIVWAAFAFLRRTPGTGDQGSVVDNPLASAPPDSSTPNSQLPGAVGTNVNEYPVPPIQQSGFTQEELDREELGQFAKEFASRFGTYSNQNFARNLEEVLPFTTGQANGDVESLRKKYQPLGNEYVGVSSVAVALSWDADAATEDLRKARVALRRIETRGSESEEYNQDLVLTLVKSNTDWKVQTIQWGERY